MTSPITGWHIEVFKEDGTPTELIGPFANQGLANLWAIMNLASEWERLHYDLRFSLNPETTRAVEVG